MSAGPEVRRPRIIAAVLLAWLAVIGFDLLLHAGILAALFVGPHPFLLEPESLFRRIPLGYLAFLLTVILLAWLMLRIGVRSPRVAALFGLQLGVLLHGSFVLGLASISTAPLAMLLGWFVGQSLQTALAGGALGLAFTSPSLRRPATIIGIFVFLCIVLTIALQSFGITPIPERL